MQGISFLGEKKIFVDLFGFLKFNIMYRLDYQRNKKMGEI